MPHATVLDVRTPGALAVNDPVANAAFAFLARYKGHTLDNYRHDLNFYLAWCAGHELPPLAAQRGHLELYTRWLENYVSPLTGRPFCQSTIHRRQTCVLLFYKYAAMDDYIAKDPGPGVTRIKIDTERQRRTFLPPLAFAAVLVEARKMGPMQHATVALLGMLGMRVSEACSLNVDSVQVVRGWEIVRFIGKGGQTAELPLPIAVMHAVHDAIGGRETGPAPLLLNKWDNRMTRGNAAAIIRTARQRAGVPVDATPHSLRRTFVTSGLLHGVPLRDMQIAARHKDPKTTIIYDMMIGGFERHASHQVAAYLSSMAG